MSIRCDISLENAQKYALLSLSHESNRLTQRLAAQIQKQAGHIAPMGHTCMMANFQMAKSNLFTSPMTILRCQTGSRGWRPSFVSAGCGQQVVCQHNVQTFAVLLEELTAAASSFFFHSPTLLIKSPSYWKLSKAMVICATSTPSTIVR